MLFKRDGFRVTARFEILDRGVALDHAVAFGDPSMAGMPGAITRRLTSATGVGQHGFPEPVQGHGFPAVATPTVGRGL